MYNVLNYDLYNILNIKGAIKLMAYKLKELRRNKGLSQEVLAEKANVSRAIISRIESGDEVVTTTETLKKIATALNVNVSDIFLD